VESVSVAGQLVAAARVEHDSRGERLAFAGATGRRVSDLPITVEKLL
jgi:hypothetical protein